MWVFSKESSFFPENIGIYDKIFEKQGIIESTQKI
jgi:hypothetical protein